MVMKRSTYELFFLLAYSTHAYFPPFFPSVHAQVNTYEILIADERAVHWEVSHGRINLEKLGARPVEAGREADGTPLYVAQAHHEGAVQPGKCGPNIDGASIAWGGKEHLKNVSWPFPHPELRLAWY